MNERDHSLLNASDIMGPDRFDAALRVDRFLRLTAFFARRGGPIASEQMAQMFVYDNPIGRVGVSLLKVRVDQELRDRSALNPEFKDQHPIISGLDFAAHNVLMSHLRGQ